MRNLKRSPSPPCIAARAFAATSARWSAVILAGLALFLTLAVTSCVSVNIGPKGAERSKDVEYKTPSAPYVALKTTRADGAWQNKSNGNSISFFSTCNDADPALDVVARELFSELKDSVTILQNQSSYNAREALDMEVEGKMDGVLTRIRAVIFKKNGCTYTLSHIGVPKAFNDDRGRFVDFLKGFQAP